MSVPPPIPAEPPLGTPPAALGTALPPGTPEPERSEAAHFAPPPLCPSATSVLASLFTLDFNLHALREKEGLSDADLTSFLADPGTRAALVNLRASLDIIDHLHHRARRRRAIDALVEVIDATTDLVEKRKAATSLLRQTARATGSRAPASPDELSPGDPHPHPRADPDGCTDTGTPPAHLSFLAHPPSRPDATPQALLQRIARAFHHTADSPDLALNILHRALAPEARIDRQPAPKDPAEFRALARSHLRPLLDAVALVPVGSEGTEFTHTEDFFALTGMGATTLLRFHLAAVVPDRWRITAVTLPYRNDSS